MPSKDCLLIIEPLVAAPFAFQSKEIPRSLEIKVRVIHKIFFSELRWGKAMVAYTKPQQRKKEESERLRGERDQIKFIDLGFERWQVVRFRKGRGGQDVPYAVCSRDE